MAGFVTWISRIHHGRDGSSDYDEEETTDKKKNDDLAADKEKDNRGIINPDSKEERFARRLQKISSPAGPSFPSIQRMPSSHADIESLTFETTDIGASAIKPVSSKTTMQHLRIQEEEEQIGLADEGTSVQSGGDIVQPRSRRSPSAQREQQIEEAHNAPKVTVMRSIYHSLLGLLTPATMGVMISLPFALINPLKALIVEVDGWSGTKIHNAPDGLPPLSFLYDFTEFVGAMTIP